MTLFFSGAITSTSYTLLNDTSFTVATIATIAATKDRHVFFQANDGTIRQVIYKSDASTWDTSSELLIARDARSHTPLAAMPIFTDGVR